MKKQTKPIIGILGGMGPQASARLLEILVELSIKEFGAKNNDEFPEILLYSIPVPDFISNDRHRGKALEMLKERAKQINGLNVSFLCLACNTTHVLFNDLQQVTKIPFISMVDEVVKQVRQAEKQKVGLLASPSTIKYGLYQQALCREGIESITPTKKQLVVLEKIIRHVLEGKFLLEDRKKLMSVANVLQRKGAEKIILGCTELPLLFPKNFPIPTFDSLEILARALLKRYYEETVN